MIKVGGKIKFLKYSAEIKYVGDYHDKPGKWVGLELDAPKGRNDGIVGGKRYFECKPKHGVFMEYENLEKYLKKQENRNQSLLQDNTLGVSGLSQSILEQKTASNNDITEVSTKPNDSVTFTSASIVSTDNESGNVTANKSISFSPEDMVRSKSSGIKRRRSSAIVEQSKIIQLEKKVTDGENSLSDLKKKVDDEKNTLKD